ncbi:hypothetical protein [Vitiosangium sp. GDMCC 1.1324]|uniref:hypothetical protein n=1 Tax=Vitiosangium sp. (strain GDMCC 1.1324) TaxID=2138576 RepID=UPI0011B49FDC|nr:hypothetical protein [Vitiosangium sp. GDMCC 1.1324]
MSDFKIYSITYVQPHVYEVIFMRDGEETTVQFTVVERAGIRAVQPVPDIFMSGAVPPREVSAAVLAFDHARGNGDSSDDTR